MNTPIRISDYPVRHLQMDVQGRLLVTFKEFLEMKRSGAQMKVNLSAVEFDELAKALGEAASEAYNECS